ncbi:MAG: P-II family nitrogen regulator [Cytophagales bacterium]|nr:MAG: P-II family nitrogen regulator [Cytophagales bacterium]
MLKKIQAIIRTSKFDEVRLALHDIGVEYFTYYEVNGVTFQNENKGSYRGTSIINAAVVPRRVLEIVVPNIDADEVVEVITKSANTGQVGDGKIYVSSIDQSIRISQI